jgi:hypothetical protein
MIDPKERTMMYWHRLFREALIAREHAWAEFYFERYQDWKRRASVSKMLDTICAKKRFGVTGEAHRG